RGPLTDQWRLVPPGQHAGRDHRLAGIEHRRLRAPLLRDGSRDGRAPDVDAECVAHGFGPAFTVLAPQLPDERMPDRNRWARRGRTLPVAGGAGAVTGRVIGCLLVVGPVRAVVQRVSRARVTVNGGEVGAIGAGLCVLVGVTHD